jgi:hypothetical protein
MARMRGIVARRTWPYTRLMRHLPRSFAARAARTLCAAGLTLGFTAEALAQPPTRVTALGDTLLVRRCAEASCDVVAELPRGQAVQVLSTANGWHRVLVTLDGSRATTGWVEASLTAVAPRAAATPRPAQPVSLPARASDAQTLPEAPSDCLTCVATRTPTTEEWNAAMKALPAPTAPTPIGETPGATPRVDTVRRDGRTTAERMRDDLEEKYGDELQRLAGLMLKADDLLQTYMGACYEKSQPIQVLPPGPTPAAGTPPPVRPRASVGELWRGRPVWTWNDTWSTPAGNTGSVAFCQGLWNDVSARATAIRSAVEEFEAQARAADVYPGVVREVLQSHGLDAK